MKYIYVIAGISLTILCWGAYGSVLHKGGDGFKSVAGPPTLDVRLKPLICVGFAYFLIAIIIPMVLLYSKGLIGGWPLSGMTWSSIAGACGALGALGIVLAMTSGGKTAPLYVMPIVFGCAPVVNVVVAVWFNPHVTWKDINPIFVAGLIMLSVGAALVLAFQPRAKEGSHAAKPIPAVETKSDDGVAKAAAPSKAE